MNIGLDWDGTVTLDPEFWSAFVELAHQYGHVVCVVTFRTQIEENFLLGVKLGCPVICTNNESKQVCALRVGFNVDVWIDDEPQNIIPGRHEFLLARERKDVNKS